MSSDIFLSSVNFQQDLEAAFYIDREPSSYYISDVAPLEDINYYLDNVEKRNIFHLTMRKTAESTTETKAQTPKAVAESKTKHLRLVGISWSAEPDAMVEDTKAKKTLFVKKGDSINEFRVAEIQRDKVILSYQGQRVELK